MQSPPPTPSTRASTRAAAALAAAAISSSESQGQDYQSPDVLRRRSIRDLAGLLTPRTTPAKKTKRQLENVDETAKILFPGRKRKRFHVYEDAKTPEGFNDERNPLAAPAAPKHGNMDVLVEEVSPTDEHRSDGLTYVFRGRKVFKKFPAADEDADSIKPKRLFQRELSGSKLSNPFEEEDDDSGFDGLELSTYRPTSATRPRRDPSKV